ncbi:MAG: Gfo/Idh/MocA family oxidoreductase [Gammaproteobacteria bacterium]|nr:Gfo/Idh/MocA family oxidoreductase [Gammaproteobacteria bacterium]MDP6535960.1 Gfo/Idh/MocA family oxidoreductase [Gammaproteobacteria bacterium]MDP6731513.1 Gfo/Idh/MocA family oxidoreductase [Gammaproteobacteria bacterium]HAJ76415.1 gfo/Idh/MocA family oxidoreductase [Gammaproteobacteria bacterium]
MSEDFQRFFEESAAARSARVQDMALPGTEPDYRLLLIGSGKIGREHIRVANLLGRAGVHGIFDNDGGSIDAALSLFKELEAQAPRVYDSLDEALADDAHDAIFICTPNYTHFDIVQQVKKTGKPLFIEKPMATSLVEAAQIVELGRDYPGFIQLGMQYRYKSQYSEAFLQAKGKQALGAIKTISMCEYRPPFLDKVRQWNKFNEFSGGTLVEKCCHYFDLINLMAESRPRAVYASGGQAVNFLDFEYEGRRSDIHDHAFVLIDYENGIRANFALNMFSQELYEELIVGGEKGRLIATEDSSFKRREESSRGRIKVEVQSRQKLHPDYDFRDVTYPTVVERSGHHGATFFEHEALVEQLDGGPADCATPLQGLWAMIVASAAQSSIERGAPIEIDNYLRQHKLSWLTD